VLLIVRDVETSKVRVLLIVRDVETSKVRVANCA